MLRTKYILSYLIASDHTHHVTFTPKYMVSYTVPAVYLVDALEISLEDLEPHVLVVFVCVALAELLDEVFEKVFHLVRRILRQSRQRLRL